MRKSVLIGGCLVFVALFLAACGGGESEEDKIVDAIETSAASDDPSACTEFATESFNEQITGQEGEAAVKQCEKDAAEEKGAESVDVSNVEVDGSTATADAALKGGSFGGQTLAVSVVKEGDQWKMNEVTGFAELNRPKLVESLEENLNETSEIPTGVVACIVEGVKAAPQEKIEELFFSGSSAAFIELAKACSK